MGDVCARFVRSTAPLSHPPRRCEKRQLEGGGMKKYRLVSVLCMGVLLLGSLMVSPALAIISQTVQDSIPGSLLVFPIFDIIGANRTKIEITNRGGVGAPGIDLQVQVHYVCQQTDP